MPQAQEPVIRRVQQLALMRDQLFKWPCHLRELYGYPAYCRGCSMSRFILETDGTGNEMIWREAYDDAA